MGVETIWPWRGALLAGAVALLWAGLFGAWRRPGLAAAGAGVGLAAGWLLTLGLPGASPRQLAERLPLLAAAAALVGALLAALGPRVWVAVATGAALLAGAWWIAGAPLHAADLSRALLVLLAVGSLAAGLLLGLRGAPEAVVAAALLAAGVWLTRPTGPWILLAAAALAAAAGALVAGRAWPPAARLAPALGLCALAAGPVLGRGSAADWTAAAAPVAAVLLGPALAARLGGRVGAPLGWAAVGGLALLFTWLLVRGR